MTTTMGQDFVIETSVENRVAVVRLADEDNRNALSNDMRQGLASTFADLEDDPEVRAVYLTGRGRAFCGGGDLRMMRDEGDAWSSHQRFRRAARWLTDMIRFPKPVVVGVNGPAVGGGIGIALVGDVILAGQERASFVSGFLRLGLLPDIGVMYTMPRLIGLARTKAFVYGNATWSASDAEQAGLVTAAVPDAELEARGLEQARAMAELPLEGFGLSKWLMGRSLESSLDEMMTYENLGQSLAYTTESMREGLSALREKRAADFVAASEREPAVRAARGRHKRD
ncbi:enoyl-CoA hydratase-related protein [Saccharomonospora sp. NPDC046836]|uniref:enoyl-CoA hydratase/isomerase family protein n=1 Tax=Saccharomonospora sp. NPDC046836 TaxID=3156921 RepID=UPI0033D32322